MNGYIDLDGISEALRTGLELKSRTYHLRNFKKSFVASDAVTFLVLNKFAHSRQDAVRIGRALSSICKLFQHVLSEKERDFKDDDRIYRFSRPTGTKFGTFYSSAVGFGVSWRSNCKQESESTFVEGALRNYSSSGISLASSLGNRKSIESRKRMSASSKASFQYISSDPCSESDEEVPFFMTANKQQDFSFFPNAPAEGEKSLTLSNDGEENGLSKIVEEGLKSLSMVGGSYRSEADENGKIDV